MSQYGNNQVRPAYSNTNGPQGGYGGGGYGGGSGSGSKQQLPPGQSGMVYGSKQVPVSAVIVNPGAGIAMLEQDEQENPCSCCCGLDVAAKVIVLLNVGFYLLAIITYWWSISAAKREDDENKKIVIRTEEELEAYKIKLEAFKLNLCRQLANYEGLKDREGASTFFYWLFLLTWVVSSIADVVTLILFSMAVFSFTEDVNQRIQYSDWYMMYHFCCPNGITTFLYVLAAITKYEFCDSFTMLWVQLFVATALCSAIDVLYGLLGKAYRNALRRRGLFPMNAPVGVNI